MSDFVDALVACGTLVDRAVYDVWHTRLFADPAHASWDPWLDKEWRSKPRTDFASISEFYDSDVFVCFQAGSSSAWPNGLPEMFAGLVKHGDRVLDYGCGHGRYGISCLHVGATVAFADVSPRLLDGVVAFCKAHNFDAQPIRITQEVPNLGSDVYDFIITDDVLEHTQQPVEVLRRLVAALKIGGYIRMTVFFNGHEMALYHLPHNFHLGDPKTWAQVCADVGLEPVKDRDRIFRRIR